MKTERDVFGRFIKKNGMSWIKYKKERFGTLMLHLKDGGIKYFCEKDKDHAIRRAKAWLRT